MDKQILGFGHEGSRSVFSFEVFPLDIFCFAELMELYETMRTELCIDINNVHEVYALPKCIHIYTHRWI